MNRHNVTVYTNDFIFTPDDGPMRRTIDIRVVTKHDGKDLGQYLMSLPKFNDFWNRVLTKYGFFHEYDRPKIQIIAMENTIDPLFKETDTLSELDFKTE